MSQGAQGQGAPEGEEFCAPMLKNIYSRAMKLGKRLKIRTINGIVAFLIDFYLGVMKKSELDKPAAPIPSFIYAESDSCVGKLFVHASVAEGVIDSLRRRTSAWRAPLEISPRVYVDSMGRMWICFSDILEYVHKVSFIKPKPSVAGRADPVILLSMLETYIYGAIVKMALPIGYEEKMALARDILNYISNRVLDLFKSTQLTHSVTESNLTWFDARFKGPKQR